ncbi:branched-chain amino acid ABC transporter permease [Candidatus Bathyarchaeota archaeon]|nr:MAG: branched-chain amino acid ABC transporter permease [Candidatus Bathyarchaeota archaeon]
MEEVASSEMKGMDVPSFVLFGTDIVTFSVDLAIAYSILLAVSLTLNLEAGYSGVPNFGKAMFVAGGAAVAGSISGRLSGFILGVDTSNYVNRAPLIINNLNSLLAANFFLSIEMLLLGLALAAGVGAVLGFLASYPAIRLREDYLGMLLLASAQFFQILLRGYPPLIGGVIGIEVPDFFGWANTGRGARDVVILGVVGLFTVLVYLYFERVARSPLGRTLMAVRDNEVASRALGKDDVAIRKRVIVIASAICGMAGALLTFYVQSVGPDTWSRQSWTFPKAVDKAKFLFQGFLPFDVNWLEYLAFSSLLLLVLALRPGGILPEKSSLTLQRETVATIVQTKADNLAQKGDDSSTKANDS